jgi:hypothetical protein
MHIPSETKQTSTGDTAVTARLTVTSVSEAQASRVSRPPGDWSSLDVFLYVTEEILRLNGPQLPGKAAQQTIESFCSRYGTDTAVRIARAVFEVYQGRWQGAPVTWRRFAPGHDAFFAEPILAAMT